MALEEIQGVHTEEKIKVYKERAANSIRYREQSVRTTRENYDKLMEKIEKREQVLNKLKEDIKQDVAQDTTLEKVVGSRYNQAIEIAKLEAEINELGIIYGPIELVGNRAIRLIDKMYKQAKARSDVLYDGFDSNGQFYEVTGLHEQKPVKEMVKDMTIVPEAELAKNPNFNIQETVNANQEQVAANIQNAINESQNIVDNSKENDAVTIPAVENNVVPEPSSEVKEEVPENSEIEKVTSEVENNANKKLNDYLASMNPTEPVVEKEGPTEEEIEEFEYAPMTDEQILASQEKIAGVSEKNTLEAAELAKYHAIIEQAEIDAKEVANINSKKGLDLFVESDSKEKEAVEPLMVESESINSDETIRDEIIEVPERPEKVGEKETEKIENAESKDTGENEEKSVIFGDKSLVVSEGIKTELESHREESIEELAELIRAEEAKRKAKEKEKENSEEALKKAKEDHEKLVENESNTEQKLAAKQAEREAKEKQLQELKEDLQKRLKALRSKNTSIESEIQKYQEELSEITEDTGKRNEHLEALNGEVASENNAISDIDEMIEKYGVLDNEDSIVEQKQV